MALTAFLFASKTLATECEIGDLWLQTQISIDSFQADYGDGATCTVLVGNLVVEQGSEDSGMPTEPIASLAGLADIVEVRGGLTVLGNPSLESLEGLGALERVTGTLRIAHNRALSSTGDLVSLTSASIVQIDHNRVLRDVAALARFDGEFPGLWVILDSNPSLERLVGMEGLRGTLQGVTLRENRVLTDLSALRHLTKLGLQGLVLDSNDALETLEDLSGLQGDIGALAILDQSGLHSLQPLSGITGVQRLIIGNNERLESLAGLEGLRGRISTLRIENNDTLRDIDALGGLTDTRDVWIIGNEALENVDGLSRLRTAWFSITIEDNPSLLNLDGFSGLERIDPFLQPGFAVGDLVVRGNPQLSDCAGLGRVLGYPTLPHDPETDGVPFELEIGETNGEGARSPDDCLDAYAERLPGTLPVFDLAVHGSWYDPASNGEGLMMFRAPNDNLSLYFYGYDEAGAPEWWVAFTDDAGGWNDSLSLTVYAMDGGSFTNFDPTLVNRVPWGTMELTLWDCRTGRLLISGPNGDRTLELSRLGTVRAAPCNAWTGLVSQPQLPIAPPEDSLTGAWYDPATDGQGFTFHHVSAERGMVYFFGYRDDGSDLWLVGPWEERLVFGEEAKIPLLEFDRGAAPGVTESRDWGMLTLTLDDCRSGTAALDGVDGRQTLDLQLLAGALGLPCENPVAD